jgi:hypothetical protein
MMKRLKDIRWIVGILFVIFLAGGAWATDRIILDGQVAENTDYRLVQTYDKLLRRINAEGTKTKTRDVITFCNAAKRLGIGGTLVKKLCPK